MRGARIPQRALPWVLPKRSTAGRLQRPTSVFTAFCAVVAMSLTAGPAAGATAPDPCALPRTGAHHSLGVDSWNPGYPRPEGTLHAVMLFLSFPDSAPRTTAGRLAADYFPAAARFFDRASYGSFRLRPHPVKRWLRMPAPASAYDIRRDWDRGLRTAYLRDALRAADGAVDFSRYDIVYLVADPDAPGVNSDATKVVNFEKPIEADGTRIRRIVTLFEQSPPDRHVLAHETGHLFDLPDLYRKPADGAADSADWDTHVGDWDVMGSQFGLAPDFFGWHKWKLGWLSREHVVCVRGTGTVQRRLRALELPLRGAGVADLRLLVVPLGSAESLVVEARGPFGNDRALCTGGILLYRVRSDVASTKGPVRVIDAHPHTARCRDRSVRPGLADAPLGDGESHLVRHGGGVRVQAHRGSAPGDWQVRITRGTPG